MLVAGLLAGAAPVAALPAPTVRIEPVHVGALWLDDVYTDVAGAQSGKAVRLGMGASLTWSYGLELGCSFGRSALAT